MKANDLYDVGAELDAMYGKKGTEQYEQSLTEAWEEYNAQILLDARKNAHLTQKELAERLGVDKGYISRIERGLTTPTISTFYKILSAMGLRIEILPM